MLMQNTKDLGNAAEKQALNFLLGKGLRLIAKNYRCYVGEIDLIMEDKTDVVFVEVRSRSRTDYGDAIASVNQRKMRRLIKTAVQYLQMRKILYKVTSRFDIIAIHPKEGKLELEWIKNAFFIKDNYY